MGSLNTSPTILICAGEASGDELASQVALHLKNFLPQAKLFGLAGEKMKNASVTPIVEAEKGAYVMGFFELATALPKIFKTYFTLLEWAKRNKPDLAILVDYPDFNLFFAKSLKKLGVPILYYVSPTIWAWRRRRAEAIKRYVDKMALLWPFEEKLYRDIGYAEAYFVGHPVINEIEKKRIGKAEREKLKENFGIKKGEKVLAIFPGSRAHELKRHLSLINETYNLIKKEEPSFRAVVQPHPSFFNPVKDAFSGTDAIVAEVDPLYTLQISDIGLLKSGTCNLQAALLELPFVMFFKASWVSAFIVRHFIRKKDFSIVNILKEGTVEEILQENAQPQKLKEAVLELFANKDKQRKMRENFLEIKQMFLTKEPAGVRTAKMALDLLKSEEKFTKVDSLDYSIK